MRQRERILLIATVSAIAIYLMDSWGGVDAVLNLATFNSAQVDGLRTRNAELRAQLDNVINIQREFREIESLFDTGSDRAGKFVITEDLNRIFAAIGEKNPSISPARPEIIPNVTEYEYLVVDTEARRIDENRLRNLLRMLEEENFIIQQVDIRSIQDAFLVNVKLKLAKIQRVAQAGAASLPISVPATVAP